MGVTVSEKNQKARAWVNFDGTGAVGTNMTIRASLNVASVFKNSTGNYTVTFATAMPDSAFTMAGASNNSSGDIYSRPPRLGAVAAGSAAVLVDGGDCTTVTALFFR